MNVIFTHTDVADYTHHFLRSVAGNDIWHITDQDGEAVPGTTTFRYPRSKGDGINLWEARARAALNIPGMYCDNDMIFQRSYEPLMDLDCDVVITRQDRKVLDTEGNCLSDVMPYNGGIILCKNTDYFPNLVEIMEQMPFQLQHWYGNQMAMKELVNAFSTVMLPCSTYNYTPDKYEDSLKDMSDKWCVHFKGARKPWMIEYAKRMEMK